MEERESVLERGDGMAEPLLFRELSDPSTGIWLSAIEVKCLLFGAVIERQGSSKSCEMQVVA